MRALLIFLLLCTPAAAREFWIDPTGGADPSGADCSVTTVCDVSNKCDEWKNVLDDCETEMETGGPHEVIYTAGYYTESDFTLTTVSEATWEARCDGRWPDAGSGARATKFINYFPQSFTPSVSLTFRCATELPDVADADELIQTDDREEGCIFAKEEPYGSDWGDVIPFGILSTGDFEFRGFRTRFPHQGLVACQSGDITVDEFDIECSPWSYQLGCLHIEQAANGGGNDINDAGVAVVIEDTSIRPYKNNAYGKNEDLDAPLYNEGYNPSFIYLTSNEGTLIDRSYLMSSGPYFWSFSGDTGAGISYDVNINQTRVEGMNQHGWSMRLHRDGADTASADRCGGVSSICWSNDIFSNVIRGRCWDPDFSTSGWPKAGGTAASVEDTFTERFCWGDDQTAANLMCTNGDNDFGCGNENSGRCDNNSYITCAGGPNEDDAECKLANTCRMNDTYCARRHQNTTYPLGDCLVGDGSAGDCGTANGHGLCGTSIGVAWGPDDEVCGTTPCDNNSLVACSVDADCTRATLSSVESDQNCGNEQTGRCDWNHEVFCVTDADCESDAREDDGENQLTTRGGRLIELQESAVGPLVIIGSTLIGQGAGFTNVFKPTNTGTRGQYSGVATCDNVNTGQWGTTLTGTARGRCIDESAYDPQCSGTTGSVNCDCPPTTCQACDPVNDSAPQQRTCEAGEVCVDKCIIDGIVFANNVWGDLSKEASPSLMHMIPSGNDSHIFYDANDIYFDYSIYTVGPGRGSDPWTWSGDVEFDRPLAVQSGSPYIAGAFWVDDAGADLKVLCWDRADPYNKGAISNGDVCDWGETTDSCASEFCPDDVTNADAFKGDTWYSVVQCNNSDGNLANKPTSGGCSYVKDLSTEVERYSIGEFMPTSSSGSTVDTGSELNTTWRGIDLCPTVDYYGNTRACVDGNTTNCCDPGAVEFVEAASTTKTLEGGSITMDLRECYTSTDGEGL